MTSRTETEHLAELKKQVALAGRILCDRGLADYLGHVSARVDDETIVIKPKHSTTIRGMGALTADQMVVVDLDGRLVGEGEPRPSEVFVHTEIYRARPDVRSIVHTHQRSATMLGILEQPVLPLLHIPSSYVAADDVATWPCAMLVTDPALGKDLADTLGDNTYCHLQGHGIVAVGGSVAEAVVRAMMLEELAQANLDALGTGLVPHTISDRELEALRAERGPIEGRWAYYLELLGASSASAAIDQGPVASA